MLSRAIQLLSGDQVLTIIINALFIIGPKSCMNANKYQLIVIRS